MTNDERDRAAAIGIPNEVIDFVEGHTDTEAAPDRIGKLMSELQAEALKLRTERDNIMHEVDCVLRKLLEMPDEYKGEWFGKYFVRGGVVAVHNYRIIPGRGWDDAYLLVYKDIQSGYIEQELRKCHVRQSAKFEEGGWRTAS